MRRIATHHDDAGMVDWHFDHDTGIHHIRSDSQYIRTDNPTRAGHAYGEFVHKAAKQSGAFDGNPITGDTL